MEIEGLNSQTTPDQVESTYKPGNCLFSSKVEMSVDLMTSDIFIVKCVARYDRGDIKATTVMTPSKFWYFFVSSICFILVHALGKMNQFIIQHTFFAFDVFIGILHILQMASPVPQCVHSCCVHGVKIPAMSIIM